MKCKIRRMIGLVLAVILCISTLPTAVFAGSHTSNITEDDTDPLVSLSGNLQLPSNCTITVGNSGDNSILTFNGYLYRNYGTLQASNADILTMKNGTFYNYGTCTITKFSDVDIYNDSGCTIKITDFSDGIVRNYGVCEIDTVDSSDGIVYNYGECKITNFSGGTVYNYGVCEIENKKSSNVTVYDLTLSAVDLSVSKFSTGFSTSTQDYEVTVSKDTTSIDITPTLNVAMTVNTVKAESGAASTVSLVDNETTISIEMTPGNGNSTYTMKDVIVNTNPVETYDATYSTANAYTLTVKKEAGYCSYNADGFCDNCNGCQPATLNNEGVYEISNSGQFYWFASLTDGTAVVKGDVTLASGDTLTISDDQTLTIADGAVLINNGTLINNSTLTNNGTIIVNGTLDTANGEVIDSGTVTISSGGTLNGKLTPTVTLEPTAAGNLIYDGSAQALVNAGEANGGKMYYSLTNNGSDWSTEVPTGTNAGAYSVFYKVVGDENYNDYTAGDPINVTISMADSSETTAPTANTLTYTGAEQVLIEAGTATGGTMYYRLDNSDWSADIPTGTNAETYTVYYKVVGDSNHDDYTPVNNSVSVTIEKADQSISYSAGSVSKHINDVAFTNELTKATVGGGITYASDDTGVATVDEDGKVTIVGAGTATITATAAATENYNEATASYTLIVTDHSYTATTVDPTYTEQGYTLHTCDICGDSYQTDATAILVLDGTDSNVSTQTTVQALTELPEGLKNLYSSVDELIADLISRVTVGTGYTADNALVYDVVLQYSTDGGITWITATVDNFPADGITVTLPYPEGTDSSYEFTVLHMFTETSSRLGITAGGTETPTITKTDDGLDNM